MTQRVLIWFLLFFMLVADAAQAACFDLASEDWQRLFSLLEKDQSKAKAWQILEEKIVLNKIACLTQKSDPALQRCFDPIENFVANQKLTRQRGHSMQFRLSNREYLESRPTGMLDFPEGLKNGLPKNWRELCAESGWSCVEFVSKSLLNPTGTPLGRLLIVAESPTVDRWMLYSMPDGEETKRLVDFIAVEKATATLAPLPKARLHFVEYLRDEEGKKPVYRPKMASCYKCHPSGMRDIIPATGSVTADGQAVLDRLNGKMHTYGPFDWDGAIRPELYGPPMGQNATCIACHDGSDRGVLNAAHMGERSRRQIYFKMVQELSMEPGRAILPGNIRPLEPLKKILTLSPKDKRALYSEPQSELASPERSTDRHGLEGPYTETPVEFLEFLRKKALVTPVDYETSRLNLERLQAEAHREYEQIRREYRQDLLTWLQGTTPECRALF